MLVNMRHMAAQVSGTSRMIAMPAAAALGAANGHTQVANGDFSSPNVSGVAVFKNQKDVAPWKTTDSKGEIKVWQGGAMLGSTKWDAPQGIKQFAEVNANSDSTLSQAVKGIPAGVKYGFFFPHRGRHSATEGDSIEVTHHECRGEAIYGRGRTENGGGPVTLSFRSVSTAGSAPTVGNFLTGIQLDQTVVPPPCVMNAEGNYDWTTDNTKTNKGNGKRENGRFNDVPRMSADGKTISGTNRIGTTINGIRT